MRPTPPLAGPTAVPATTLLFVYTGLVIGTWSASLPGLRGRLGLDSAGVSIALVVMGLCAIAAMQAGGRLSDRFGARRVALAAAPVLAAGIAGVGFAPTFPTLLAAAVVTGLGHGAIDVSMNLLGVQVERHRGRPIMSRFHGLWSVGNFSGAAIVLVLALIAPAHAVLLACLVATLFGLVAWPVLVRIAPETEPVTHVDDTGSPVRIPTWAWALGLMAVAFGLGEGTAMGWSGILVTDVARVPAVQGSMAVTVVAAFMVIIRLLGDRLVARFGRRTIVRVGGVCASAGYFVAAFATPLPVLLVGWALVGFGIGLIAPQVYAVAGHAGGGRVLAVVVTFGYATFLGGPAVIGFLVQTFDVQRAMLLPAVLLAGLPLLARAMRE
ncbi:MFS transporter [Piscicoccus intestinalis]|uniref:MFS transporter n=1 Tax=Piscicoccus intestinalis TaxID=746033 RepID=UPI000838E619|nr:MFS transporter [Piscicoccus intestinalis]